MNKYYIKGHFKAALLNDDPVEHSEPYLNVSSSANGFSFARPGT